MSDAHNIHIPHELYAAIRDEGKLATPPVSATHIILTLLYKTYPHAGTTVTGPHRIATDMGLPPEPKVDVAAMRAIMGGGKS